MIPRYASSGMESLWSESYKRDLWLRIITKTAEECYSSCEQLPESFFFGEIKMPTESEIATREATTRHDVAAFVQLIHEQLQGTKRDYFYFGLTASDVVDTAQSLRIHKSGKLMLDAFDEVGQELNNRIDQNRNVKVVGRTHGRAAESVALSTRFMRILEDIDSARTRFCDAVNAASVCMLSGPTGNYSVLDKGVERRVAEYFNLQPASSLFTTTQVLPRRLITEVIQSCSVVASAIESGATQIRLLSLSEINEVSEAFEAGQIGSTSMAHKSNPVVSEKLCGLARLLRGMVAPASENVPLWFERDISHSSVERIILPDAFALVEHMLLQFAGVLRGLVINHDAIERNLRNAGMAVHSHNLLCWLIEHGFDRFEAYRKLQSFFRNGLGSDAEDPETFAHRFSVCFDLDLEEIETEINKIIHKG